MSKSHRHAGQFNLKGKKSRVLACRCCEVVDLRVQLSLKELRRELANAD